MAKVQGPLFSVEASGTYAGAITFAKWKGRQYCRNRVDPANPHAAGQETARNRVRVVGAGQHFANLATTHGAGRTVTDKAALIALAPAGQAWNGFLSKSMIGAGAVNYIASAASWAARSAGEKTAWETAADGLTPVFPDVAQTTTGGGSAAAMTAGEAFYRYQYGLYVAGVAGAPGAVPPVYA